MKFYLHRNGATFGEFPIIFLEREAGHSKFSRKILYEGMRFPLKALGKRISRPRSLISPSFMPTSAQYRRRSNGTEPVLLITLWWPRLGSCRARYCPPGRERCCRSHSCARPVR